MTDLTIEDMNPGERYEFIRIRGKGSYGLVGEYLDKKTKKNVAIKRMNTIVDIIDAKRMLREIRILRHFKHENIIKLKSIVTKPNTTNFFDIYLITDVWDIDLSKIIKKSREELSDDHIQYITYQIFRGVQYLHSSNLLHRDLKPSNILANECCDICLCDFGFAREITNVGDDLTEYVITRYYRAPEVMLSSQNYGQGVDVWAIGCTIFELLTGKAIFQSKHYLELIRLIVEKLGTPSEEELEAIENQQAIGFLKKLPFVEKKRISDLVGDYGNKKIFDLLDRCLVFDQRKRISCIEAMRHPYFDDIFEESHIVENLIEIDFSFEKDKGINFEKLKVMILKEIEELNKENGEEELNLEMKLLKI